MPSDSAVAAVTVTVLSKNSAPAAAIPKDDIIVREGRVRKNVIAFIPARGDHASLQLVIVVDDASRKDIGNELMALKNFILEQPASTTIGLYYALGGSLRVAAQLTNDHSLVAGAVRLPLGDSGNLVSPYSAISQLIDGWPLSMSRREILLITPGLNLIHNELFSPDLKTAIEEAQRAGIVVHPILVSPGGRLSTLSEHARSNLNELANETGGASLVGALSRPLTMPEETCCVPSVRDTLPVLSLGPTLKTLQTALENQYFLVWKTAPSKNKQGELRSFTLMAEDKHLQITTPAKAFVPYAAPTSTASVH